MKLTNEEIARVFAMYSKQKVFTKQGNELTFCGSTADRNNAVLNHSSLGHLWSDWSEIQFASTPLSKISDEDAIEVAKISTRYTMSKDETIWYGRMVVNFHFEDCSFDYSSEYDTATNRTRICNVRPIHLVSIFQYLVSRGYAIPLFFAPNHWANGKTAIELEIATEEDNLTNQRSCTI